MSKSAWSFVLTDSLEKVYPDSKPRALDTSIESSVFIDEPFSFQLAIRPPLDRDFRAVGGVTVEVDVPSAHVSIAQVDLVPVTLAAFPETNEGYDKTEPGLYPDVLRPVADGRIQQIYGHWTAAWIDVRVSEAPESGVLDLPVKVFGETGELLFEETLELRVINATLPKLDIVNCHWFHSDGLASYYGVEVFDEDHWDIIDAFIASAAKMRVNSILTPTWTPPLDTAVGGVRLPTQLIGIADASADASADVPANSNEGTGQAAAKYIFSFEELLRWMEICKRHGIEVLEIAHLFTQWGAKATPAIYVANENGLERRFGWDVPATAPEYRELMQELIPQLREVLDEHWGLENVIFHISDEPHGDAHKASYQAAKQQVADLLEGVKLVDALSDYNYYAEGLVPHPIVATDATAPFFDANVEKLWIYYCVAQDRGVANRFISMPSSRNRVIGQQLFAKDCGGFLHWGFNFYNNVHSERPINPFNDTCAGGGFPGGDSFMVYPGPEGTPWESLRFKVFAQAMDDHRAFTLLAKLRGREAVLELLEKSDAGTLTIDNFSYDPNFYRTVREAVNKAIEAAL